MVLITVPQEVYQSLQDRCGIVLVTAQTGVSSSLRVVLTHAADWVYGPGERRKTKWTHMLESTYPDTGISPRGKASDFDSDIVGSNPAIPIKLFYIGHQKTHANTRLVSTVLHFH